MSSYLYHVSFELTSHPDPSEQQDTAVFVPQPTTDLFQHGLPAHSVSPLGEDTALGKTRTRAGTRSGDGTEPLHRVRSLKHSDHTARSAAGSRGETGLSKSTAKIKGAKDEQVWPAEQDWRYDLVTIQSIDMVESPQDVRGQSRVQTSNVTAATTGHLATRGHFVPSDPKNTDVGWGVVHLYRDAYQTPGIYDEESSASYTGKDVISAFQEDSCTTLCIVAVPSYMTPSDLLGFVGEQARDDVSHFRLIRTGRANKYMVLMKFRDAKAAKAFRNEYNGRPFNSMDSEYCHVVFVASITFQTEASDAPTQTQASFPDMSNDPFTPNQQLRTGEPAVSPGAGANALAVSAKPLAPPTPALVELPTCPVCLERMDDTTGLLTILCQHVFHCSCLEKWRGSGCPVCRYTQNSSMPRRRAGDTMDDDQEDVCSICGTDSNLWICLICGNIGCGRYDDAHAFSHYELTGHSYAMDIETQHVWDYVGDGYVHRLITNKADGKVVDLPAANSSGYDKEKDRTGGMIGYGADMVPREKMEAMGNEYAYLLTSQLDSQRKYFEEQLERAVDKAAKASSTAEKATGSLDSLNAALQALQTSYNAAQAQMQNLEKEAERSRKRAEKADELARRFTKSYQEEKAMNDSLMERIKHNDVKAKEWEEKINALTAEKSDLEEQNRDLSFFISGQAKLQELEAQGEEVAEGTVEVPVSKAEGKKKKGRKK